MYDRGLWRYIRFFENPVDFINSPVYRDGCEFSGRVGRYGGGGRKEQKGLVSKTSSGMPCKRSIISMPSSLLGETGAVAEDVVAEYEGDGVVAEYVVHVVENVKFST